jgi:hypothetical protein
LPDPESNTTASEVIVTNHQLSDELTTAYWRPSLVHNSETFVDLIPKVFLSSPTRRVLLLHHRMNKVAIAIILMAATFLWLVIAFSIGLTLQNVEVACAVAGVGVRVLAVVAAVTAWLRQ